MRKKIFVIFGLVLLFTLLLSAQIGRPIFADQCPLSCPISSPITEPIINPTDTPTITPEPTLSMSPSLAPSFEPSPSTSVSDTPVPTESGPTPTPIKKHHGDFGFIGRSFHRFSSLNDIWARFFRFFSRFTASEAGSLKTSSVIHRQLSGFSSDVQYLADSSCTEEKTKNYSRFDF